MYYREIEPSQDLRDTIVSFWEFAVPVGSPSPIAHEIMPDGCVSLFYIRNLDRGVHIAGLSGLYLEAVTKPVGAGDIFWGMRISPAALADVLGGDSRALFQKSYFGPGPFPHLLDGTAEELAAAADLEEARDVFEKRIRASLIGRPTTDAKMVEAIRLIEETRGEIRVDDLAEKLVLSTRQFQRKFQMSSGLTPKQYIRTRRIRAAAVHLVENREQSWAGTAAELGFADQSHLTHEFTALTSRSPNSFARKLSHIRHGRLVK